MFTRPGLLRARAVFVVAIVSLTVIVLSAPAWTTARQATPIASRGAGETNDALPPAWLEFGPGGQLLARVVVAGACPALLLDGRTAPMATRSSATTDFPVVACEATIPFGVQTAVVNEWVLPIPDAPFERIAVIGDTGCRLNDWEKNYQDCNDPQAWPFAEVAASVAAWQPDLIVHVGDYLYRESPCPATGFDCAGSPHGDNWPTWNADFFAPASSLLGSAPWVFMRGNHETCDRNAGGWFAYLDARPFQLGCQAYTEPYVAPLIGLTFAVLDSAEASDETVKPGEVAEYTREFTTLGELAPPGSWLVTHRPVWAIFDAAHGETEAANASYQAAAGGGSLEGHYGLVLSGHVHLAEALAFDEASGRPPQVISGNSGTGLDNIPTASPAADELGDPEIEEAETLSSFGFLTLTPDGDAWLAVQRDAQGQPLLECRLDLPEMSCESGK